MSAGADHTERRATIEVRAAAGRKLVGMAAVYSTPAAIGGFVESIRPGAFRVALASGADIRALVDHDDTRLLGRTGSGTLRLADTDKGLAFEIDVPDTSLGRDVYALAQRGDLSGCSFAFSLPADGSGDAWPTRSTRELRNVTLHEISILHRLPAYDATSVAARSLRRAEATARVRAMLLETL